MTVLTDFIQRSDKVELTMFVLACAMQTFDLDERVAYTEAMLATGTQRHLSTL